MEQILLQGAIAFAKGALGYLGGQAIGGWLRESPEQKLRELYMEACYEFFDAIGELSDEQTQALAHFFGSERVAAAASTFLGEGHVDRRAFEDEWAQLGGTRAEITRFVTVFEECFTREAQRRLRYEDQLLAGVLLSKLGPVGRPVGRSAAAELELAEQRVSRIETPGLRQLENRIDAQVSDIKARRRYKTALATLEGLRKEVDRPQIVKANPQLVAKLYTNLAVCAEKLNQLAKAERYGRRAVHLDPRDARALVNLAVVLFRRNFKNPQARQLIRKARKLDAEYRPAQLVEVGMIADSRSPAAALRVARRRPWFMQDGAGLYMYSQLSWAVGERDKATQAAQESATLEPTADHLAWAGRLLTGEEQSTTFEIKVHGASDPSKNALNQAFELLWRAADRFFEEERSDLGFAARVDSTRMLIALGRYSEAKPILQDIISKADDPRILGPTYSNLIESSLQAREQAIDIAFEAIVKVPSAPALKFSLARALIAEGRHDEARRYLREVISTRSLPGSLRLHARLMLANNFLNASQIDEARSVLKAVPAKAHPFAATSWSRLDFSEGKPEQAKRRLMALASENWSERDVVLVSAEYLRAFGATSEAAQLYQRLLELMGDNREEFTDEQLLLWATASLHAEKFEQCISLEPRAASDTRHRLQLGLIRAQALIALDIWEEALVEYQTLAADAPRDREVLDGLMTVAFRLNRPEIAIAPLQSFVDAGDGDAHDYANLAVLYALAGDKEASVRRTRKSIELSPDDPLVLRRGIQLLLRNGRVDLAVENINLYLAKFKEEEDFVQVWTGSPDELSQKFIKEVVLPAVERHQKIGELYQRHPLPLGMLAKAAGRSYINMWHGVRRGELNAPFQVNRARDFAGNALEIARSADSVVIGESALLTLGLLDLLSALAEVFEEAKIPLEVNDDVREELIRAESQLLRSVSESIQRHRQFAIVNAGSSRLFDADIREALGDQEVSALTLASELGVPLLDDDQGLRDLASGREVRSFGVRSLLEIMLERSIIDGRLYSRSVARLAAENYYFIPYNGQVLMDTILGADFEESPEVRALVSMIWKGDADVASYIGVYGSAICGLWQHTPVGREVSRDEWTRRLLAQLSMRGDIFMPLRAMARVIALIAIHDPKQLPTLCFNLLNICTVQLGIEDAYVLGVLAAVVRSLSAAPHHGIATAQLVISSIGIYWQARLKRLLRSQDQHLHDLLFPLELPD